METPAREIASVEYLRAWQTNLYMPGAANGCIRVLTRNVRTPAPAPTQGTVSHPLGLTLYPAPKAEAAWSAPEPGKYVLLVDVLTPQGVTSLSHAFEVVE